MSNSATPENFPLHTQRHSCAHLMAAAVHALWPSAQFGTGPAIDNGFYYDVLLDKSLDESDLAKIETEMKRLKKQRLKFERSEWTIDSAIQTMQTLGQDFKVELLYLLKEKGSTAVVKETGDAEALGVQLESGVEKVSFYQTGGFMDLCRGPHVEHTGQIPAFKLTHLAGAYWRGDNTRPQLQRIYGLCYPTQEEVDAEIWRMEQVKLRDHRRLGKNWACSVFLKKWG